MFRNYLAAALRNLARNRLYAAINIIGLAVGFAAAILIGLTIADELSYDRWLPEHERLYLETTAQGMRGEKVGNPIGASQPETRAWLAADFPQIRIARLRSARPGLRHGDREMIEPAYWADPDILDVLRLPLVAGDADALRRPDGLVLTQRMALKLFGRENVLGEVVELDRTHALQVTAILEDLPGNTHLNTEILLPGVAAFSELTRTDLQPPGSARALFHGSVTTYLRLLPGASIEDLRMAMPDFLQRHMPALMADRAFLIDFIPVADLHLHPTGSFAMRPKGSIEVLYALAAVGALILLVASINFINLMTARASRRAVEIGVRKATGGSRRHLVQQFVGEALIYAALAMAISIALVEAALPSLNGFLDKQMALLYLGGAAELAGLGALLLFTGLAAGTYPGLVLASLPPASVLRGGVVSAAGSGALRLILVSGQFAVLIGLIVTTSVIYRQTIYAVEESLRLEKDQVLIITAPRQQPCDTAFAGELRRLGGVKAVSCSLSLPLGLTWGERVTTDAGVVLPAVFNPSSVDAGFFPLYGIEPLAGRLFAAERGDDIIRVSQEGTVSPPLVLNETAVRNLGYSNPAQAIGQRILIRWNHNQAFKSAQPLSSEIIGVIADFPVGSIRREAPSLVLYSDPNAAGSLSVKLTGRDIPDTLRAIDALWNRLGDPRPISRFFLDEAVQRAYLDIRRQSVVFGVFAAVAIFIACLGLLGLAAFTAERRTKEIGIRKAMGAAPRDILRLLLWQFAKPVLWANLVAWPIAFYLMDKWLKGFAYRISLEPWMFLAAAATALVIALATVAAHSMLAARTRPILALRYE